MRRSSTADLTTTAIDMLAIARLARLATADRVTRRVRRAAIVAIYHRAGAQLDTDAWMDLGPSVVTDDPDAPELAYLLSCPWCVSIWIGAAVVLARRTAPGIWDPIARLLAGSQIAGMVA